MNYEIYYDIASSGFTKWASLWFNLPFVVAVIYLFYKPISYSGASKSSEKIIIGFRYIYLFMTLLVLITSIGSTYSDYMLYKKYRENNEFQMVEGVITNFQPHVERQNSEQFCVTDVCFVLRGYQWGFREIVLNGSPIHDGLPVRIAYVVDDEQNIIVRLEIGE